MSRDEVCLHHILEAILAIEEYAASGKSAFDSEPMRRDAIVRRLEVIGEAAKLLSERARGASPTIPWRRVAGLRDRLIHAYDSIDFEIVWEVVVRDVPDLKRAVQALLGVV